MNRSLAMQAVLVAASAMAITATAETESPHDFVDDIYKHYRGKDSKGLALSNEAVIRRYFAPPLADAIVKDFAAAQKAGECRCSTAIRSSTRNSGRSQISMRR